MSDLNLYLDLGPGEDWLEPRASGVASVRARLLAAGSREDAATIGATTLVRLAGLRFQDVAALAAMSDGDMLKLITDAQDHIDWLLAFIHFGHPAGSEERSSHESEDDPLPSFNHLPTSSRITKPGSERLRTLIRRVAAPVGEPRAKSDTDIGAALIKFQGGLADLSASLAGPTSPPPPETVDQFMPSSPAPAAIRDVQRAYLTNALSRRQGGRRSVPEPLVNLIIGAASVWLRCAGDWPSRSKDDDGRYYGPFILLLHDLADTYGFPRHQFSTRVIAKAFTRIPKRRNVSGQR